MQNENNENYSKIKSIIYLYIYVLYRQNTERCTHFI